MSNMNLSPRGTSFDWRVRALGYFIIFWYIFICLVSYLNQRPLWNDEQCVLNSIRAFSAQEMFGAPLLNLQVFPRVYLFLIQKFSALFNFHILSLRFPSFVCMIAAFFLWLRIMRREFDGSREYLVFALSWPASSMLIYYSSELKQYSMDVLAAAVFALFICQCRNLEEYLPKRNFLGLLILLPFLGLFSYPASLFSLIVLYNFFVFQKEDKNYLKYMTVFGLSFMVTACLLFFVDMRWRPSRSILFVDYFIYFDTIGDFLKTWGEGTNNLFSRFFVEQPRPMKSIVRIFVGFGLFNMFYAFFKNIKKDKFAVVSLKTMGLVLYAQLFILGALKVYPFTVPRTSLFFFPVILYLTITGMGLLSKIHRYLARGFLSLYVIFLIFMAVCLSRLVLTGQNVFNPIF